MTEGTPPPMSPPPMCPILFQAFVLPKRLKIEPRRALKLGERKEVKAHGILDAVTVGVQSNLSMDQLAKNPELAKQIPSQTQVPVPLPMIPYQAYVEYEGRDGVVSADLADDNYKVVTVAPPCQEEGCRFWSKEQQDCRLLLGGPQPSAAQVAAEAHRLLQKARENYDTHMEGTEE